VLYEPSTTAIVVFSIFLAITLGLSFYLGRQARTAAGYFAAHGGVPWWVNGVAFAGDYLSAASFLGICGMIAFYGYDGFLYSIGYLAGWIVALFVIAEPLKRMGKYTFADALDAKFNSRGIKWAAACSTLVISLFYLIPQMVGAGALVKPLFGFSHATGVVVVGAAVIAIVVTAGMVSTTYVQFIKGALLVVFCTFLTGLILMRGLDPASGSSRTLGREVVSWSGLDARAADELPLNDAWKGKPYRRFREPDGSISVWRIVEVLDQGRHGERCQMLTVAADGTRLVNGLPQSLENDLRPVGTLDRVPERYREKPQGLGPFEFLRGYQESAVTTWLSETIPEAGVGTNTVYYPQNRSGADLLMPGGSPTFKSVRGDRFVDKLDFLSLMLALFAGTASLPHILIRYYTVKDQASARKSTVVGIAAIGAFYVLTLYLGLGASISGSLDVTNNNMAAPLLARSFGELPFAIVSAIAFTTVLGTVSGLILAAAGAVAHDLVVNVFRVPLSDGGRVRVAKLAAAVVGVLGVLLGIAFEKVNVTFLVGWAFNVAASANLPALVMLLFWKRTTKEGIAAGVFVGMITSLGWILTSPQAFKDVYGLPPADAWAPFSQPGLVTIPLGFLVVALVSWMTQPRRKPSTQGASASGSAGHA
jgi:cation/acetate symporter